MSTLTSYQIVAAVGTLVILTCLNFVGGLWQDIPVVQEITWWLSLSGRAKTFTAGLICSEDVVYFGVVIGLFLTLSVLKLIAKSITKCHSGLKSKNDQDQPGYR